jgi:hypothetical protein
LSVFRSIGLALVSLIVLGSVALADIALPPPQTSGGIGFFETLKHRSSAKIDDFYPDELSLQELSTILWAGSGLNRREKGWTVPMAMGFPPYVKIYVAGDKGIWLYNWEAHSLKEISKENVKTKIGKQPYVGRASNILILVSDPQGLKSFNSPEARAEFAYVLTGAMTQNIYLTTSALKLKSRYLKGLNKEFIQKALSLKEGEEPICLMMVGK